MLNFVNVITDVSFLSLKDFTKTEVWFLSARIGYNLANSQANIDRVFVGDEFN